ncbi:MAG: 3-oxoacyl-ACP reductase FabG [Chlamydiae bacterium]|jgi:3-oxoacyl-[acyl-carrier protein] reductase|nr:3-oxoacyl-ACP reductase FabG [Chlamydiota bacterium]
MHLLKGKVALVTGGTAGIGRDIALHFARHGADVAVFGTNAERAQQILVELDANKAFEDQRFCVKLVSVEKTSEVQATIAEILEAWNKIDVLVNNAGITRDQLLMKLKEEDWDAVIDVNLKSVYNTCQAVIRPMMKARSGKIINISSVVGLTGNAGQVNYAASKAGMIGFTKSLALEVATRGINVNCIAPGFIKTRMTDELTDVQKEGILSKIPMGKMGTTQNIADTAVFLASEWSEYITGQVLTVDGGMVM